MQDWPLNLQKSTTFWLIRAICGESSPLLLSKVGKVEERQDYRAH
ncbi:hypothetical protein CGBL_0100980 [Corynebacterium glutamicum]|nr:hypothetical protein CGBL_0100980 [Corynebacterium glutamicum]